MLLGQLLLLFISGLHSSDGSSDCCWSECGEEEEAGQPVSTTKTG